MIPLLLRAVIGEMRRVGARVVASSHRAAGARIAMGAMHRERRSQSWWRSTNIEPLINTINGTLLARLGAPIGLARLGTLALARSDRRRVLRTGCERGHWRTLLVHR